VTDAYSARAQGKTSKISIRAGGRVFELKRIAEDPHVFGPLIYAAPKDLALPGLRFDGRPVKKGERVHFAIATGERTGIGSGTVAESHERTIRIEPVGPVANQVELEAFVAPGACGAPVVDESFAVRGFITAGSADASRPITYMLPARRWKHMLALNAKG
jgi:S1-C subfamily serine protease